MSLTAEIKAELAAVPVFKHSVRYAELAAILRLSGGLHRISGKIVLEMELDSPIVVRRVQRDLAEIFGVRTLVSMPYPGTSKKNPKKFIVRINQGGEVLARQIGILDARNQPVKGLPNKLTTASRESLVGVWRGAFLAAGTMSDPGRSSSLEVVCPTNEVAMALVGAAHRLSVSAKSKEIRQVNKVVIRDSEQIAYILKRMGSRRVVKVWEEKRQQREVRANANRLVNFDDANLRRSAQAAVTACARVSRALEILGDNVPAHLKYAGELRLKYRDSSLDELGAQAHPPLTKDAIAGRIRRLLATADREATLRGVPGTDALLQTEYKNQIENIGG